MTNATILIPSPFNIIWEFIKPVLSDSLKDRLKPKGSVEIAKKRALRLYGILGAVNILTDSFIAELRHLLEFVKTSASEGTVNDQIELIFVEANILMKELERLIDILEEINPQLEIHQFELVQRIKEYPQVRSALINKTMPCLNIKNEEDIQKIVNEAEENRTLIFKATEEFRIFLKNEFSFKESF